MSGTDESKGGLAHMLETIDRAIAHLEEFIMGAGVVLMAVNTIANVISRFIFDHSIIFAEEVNSILILLVTFAGIGYAARRGRHIRMSAFYDAMTDTMRKRMMTIITAVTGVIMLGLAYYAVEYIVSIYPKGRVMPALGVPVYLVYVWVPIGCFITGVQYTLAAYKNLTEEGIFLSTNLREQDLREEEI